ncbi:MAG: histidine triad nucleotide-binding protein [Candidatus Methylumidiphilus sp.]
MTDCLFCKLATGEITPATVYETDHILAFRDIYPRAPTHVLVIPKQHIATLNDLDDLGLAGELLLAVREVAKLTGIAEDGYRTVINCGGNGGQEVFHLHVHVLGGRTLHWPPG